MSSDRTARSVAFTRWPGLFRLSIDVLGGPVFALINEQAIYAGDLWACGHNAKPTLHIIPALCLIAVIGAMTDSWMIWRATGRGVEDELGSEETRTRFLSLVGVMVGAISAVVIIEQWFAILVFSACMRA